VVVLGLLALLGLLILVVVKVVSGVRTIAPAVKEGWKYSGEIRAADARTVEMQQTAGAEYVDKLTLKLSPQQMGSADKGLKVRLVGKISNNGDKDVLVAVATVEFPYKDPAKPPAVRTVLLFDASPNSVRPDDRRLGGGEVRDLDAYVDDVPADWDAGNIFYKLSTVRVDVGEGAPGEPANGE